MRFDLMLANRPAPYEPFEFFLVSHYSCPAGCRQDIVLHGVVSLSLGRLSMRWQAKALSTSRTISYSHMPGNPSAAYDPTLILVPDLELDHWHRTRRMRLTNEAPAWQSGVLEACRQPKSCTTTDLYEFLAKSESDSRVHIWCLELGKGLWEVE